MTVVGSAEITIAPLLDTFEAQLKTGVEAVTTAPVPVAVTPTLDTTALTQQGDASANLLQSVFDASVTKISGKFGQLGQVGAATFSQLAAGAGKLGGSLGPVVIGIAATLAAFGFAKKSVGTFTELAGEVRAFQRTTGAAAEEASTMVAVLNRLGVEPEAVSRALVRLSAAVASGKDELAKYGVEVATTADGSADLIETFLSVADAVQELGPGLEANALAAEVFGSRIANQLLPVLLKGREGIEDLRREAAKRGLVFSNEDFQKAKEFGLAQKDLSEAFTALQIQLGRTVIPLFTGLVKVSTLVIDKFLEMHEQLVGLIPEPLRDAFNWFLNSLDGSGDSASGLAAANEFLGSSFDDLGLSADDAAAKLEAMIEAETSLLDAHLAVESANRALARSQESVLDAENKLAEVRHGSPAELRAQADATAALTDATEEAGEAERDLARLRNTEAKRAADLRERAEIGLASATDSLDDAIRDQAAAVRELNEARAAGGDPEALARSEERIADAVTSVAKARRELAIAESRVIAGREAKSIAESVEANAKVAEAQERVREAEEAQASERAKADAVRAEGAEFILGLEEQAEDASLRVRQARQGVTTATDELREAERQQREGTDELIAAQDRAEESAGRVREAQDRLREANEALIPKTDELREAEGALTDARAAVVDSAIAVAKANASMREEMLLANGVTVDAADRQRLLYQELDKVAKFLGPESTYAKNIQARTRDFKHLTDEVQAFIDKSGELTSLILGATGIDPTQPSGVPRESPVDPAAILGLKAATGAGGVVPVHIENLNITEAKDARATGSETVRALKSWGWVGR